MGETECKRTLLIEGKLHRKCTKCHEYKSITGSFNKDKKGFKGRGAQCVECLSSYKRNYYLENLEREKARAKVWYEENKEFASESQRNYREGNKEKVAEGNRRYRLENIDRLRVQSREYRERNKEATALQKRRWYLANKDTVTARNLRRRARESLSEGKITTEQLTEIKKKFAYRCALTGEDCDLSIDHVIPVITGYGHATVGNLIPLKEELNYSKGPKHIFEWFEESRVHYKLSRGKFNKLIQYLSDVNGMTVREYRIYMDWCFDNPRNISETEGTK